MYRFTIGLLFWLFLACPVFSQTGQDTVPKSMPDTIASIDTFHKAKRPVVKEMVILSDTIAKEDTIIPPPPVPLSAGDSISPRPLFLGSLWQVSNDLPLAYQVLQRHPYFNFSAKPMVVHASVRKVHGKETLFYVLVGFLLLFALIRQGFGKYFTDLMRVFFRSTLKQRQIREQLMQSPLPSLVFNIFFVISAGLYIDFLLQHFRLTRVNNFWLLYLYCCLGLTVIYFVKFIGLKITGWLFNMRKAADSYVFIVFSINKILGIFLVPFPILLAFTADPVYTVSLVLSWCGIGLLLLYRLILGFGAIRNEVRFNLFHFFLYLCAFELAPLLLIYKLLLLVF